MSKKKVVVLLALAVFLTATAMSFMRRAPHVVFVRAYPGDEVYVIDAVGCQLGAYQRPTGAILVRCQP